MSEQNITDHRCILCNNTNQQPDRHAQKLYFFDSTAGKERGLKVKLESILGNKLILGFHCGICLYHVRKLECLWNGVSTVLE